MTAIHRVQYVPREYRPDARAVIRDLKVDGVQIVVLEQTSRSGNYTCVPYQFPLCLVLGHERQGLEDPILELADHLIEVPMYGMGNSLNVAMAFGICVYEMLRCCYLGEQSSE
ncbi:MAG: hypothetical protein IT435_08445 [Phycisphaerales bacterium]|nr:hypothetical protein [Phycisphaerales bacterium]